MAKAQVPQSSVGETSDAEEIAQDAFVQLLDHWERVPGMQDIKMSRLAAKGGWAIYYYAPSLVQHVGRESTWGGGYHYAPDFDPRFKIFG